MSASLPAFQISRSRTGTTVNRKATPASRPLRGHAEADIAQLFERAIERGDGLQGAHCVHEHWMRGAMGVHIERALERLWAAAAQSIPDWLPMRYVEWLPQVYDIATSCRANAKGRSNIYLVLLDYAEDLADPHGIYVGMSQYSPMQRFDQHKAGIRAAGSVLKRGVEVLTGPTLHLQFIQRAEAQRIEGELAERLAARGLKVKGGH